MNAESQLSKAEHEMIGTYVSDLNHCNYCVSTHAPALEKLGIRPAIVDQLLDAIDDAQDDWAQMGPVIEQRFLSSQCSNVPSGNLENVHIEGHQN